MTGPFRTLHRSVSSAAAFAAIALAAGAPACGSSDSTVSATGAAGTGGSIASSGHAGASGQSQTAGSSATGGKGGGPGGASGHGGAVAGGASGGAGSSGHGGQSGHAGAGGLGSGGACAKDADCTTVPATTPANCAEAYCDPAAHACGVHARDIDGDGHRAAKCESDVASIAVVVGDDCNDADATTFPGAWDGPAGDGHATSACDGIDNDCSGVVDDGALKDGTTCTCAPGAQQQCGQYNSGKPIDFPLGTPTGQCHYGQQTCNANGTWGPCGGAQDPQPETCNKLDDDCDGVVDNGPPPDNVPTDAIYFAYDGDNDQHGRIVDDGYALVHACAFNPPTAAPTECTSGTFDDCKAAKGGSGGSDSGGGGSGGNGPTDLTTLCCPPSAWKFANAIESDDCDDEDSAVHPTAPEQCDGVDHDCSGVTSPSICVCAPNEVDNQCSMETTGAPIGWPLGAPAGSCAYGSRQCASDGKSWGPCNGAIKPAVSDNCAIKGNDDTCNNVPNEGCDCTGSTSVPCGSTVGSCTAGTQTCQPTGKYGTCIGATLPKTSDTCDPGNDDNCDGASDNGFPGSTAGCRCINGTQRACGECNAGSETCVNGDWGSCFGGPGNIGAKCNIDGKVVGSCANGGTLQCDSSNPAVPKCVSPDSRIDNSQFTYYKSATGNGSYDWTCDNAIEYDHVEPGLGTNTFWPNAAADCNGYINSYQNQICDLLHTNGGASACNGSSITHTCGVSNAGPGVPASLCNVGLSNWNCAWDSGSQTCVGVGSSYTYYVMSCH